MDLCVPTCCHEDVRCLDVLLRSLKKFAGLSSCNLLVSHNSSDGLLRKMLVDTCESYRTKSLSIDFFEPRETVDSLQHGEAVNRLVARTTCRYVIIVDTDVIVVSPGWLDFCKRHIDQGCFIVGTPYHMPKGFWQGLFPNIWCSMLNGDALRSANIDMRTKHIYFNKKINKWVCLPPDRDCGWRLAHHALENNLSHVSLECKPLKELFRSPHPGGGVAKKTRRAESQLDALEVIGFAYPGTNNICCLHLNHAVRRPERVDEWVAHAKIVVDAYSSSSG